MYTTNNYRTKKALQDAVKAWVQYDADRKQWQANNPDKRPPPPVTYYQPNSDVTGHEAPKQGRIYCEGPHYPDPHRWYAQCEARDGKIVKVK